MERIAIELIESLQLRVDTDYGLDDMKNSLRRYGQLLPIRVRDHPTKHGLYQVVFGNRRLEAAKALGWTHVNAEVVDAGDTESLLIALAENLDRKDFSDYEKGLTLNRIALETGKSYTEIASLIGKSIAFVSLHIAMLSLFPEGIAPTSETTRVLNLLSEKHARVLSKVEDLSERWSLAKLSVGSGLGVRELERICMRSTKHRSSNNHSNRKKAVEEVIRRVVMGLNCRDVRPLMESVASKNFTMFSRHPPFYRMNKERAVDHLCSILRNSGGMNLKIEDLEIRIAGNFCFATCYLKHELKLGPKCIKTKTRCTMILIEEEGKWKIVHEHLSTANPLEFSGIYNGDDMLADMLRQPMQKIG